MNIAVIPARGGSKRIPRKNIKPFHGKPIIAWSIEAAIASEIFDRIVISTDDDEIAAVARQYGAEVPFRRPPEIAGDLVGTIPVIRHAVETLMAEGCVAELACCIYPTAPFVTAALLREGLSHLQASDASYVFPVTTFEAPIQRAIRITDAGRAAMFFPEQFHTRSQDLESAYHDAGQFYWGTSQAWLDERIIFSPESIPLIVPRERVQDIDTEEDWSYAELLFEKMQKDIVS